MVQELLSNSLRPYLGKINIAHSLRLVHGNYLPAQEIGWILLSEHIEIDILSVKQVLHLQVITIFEYVNGLGLGSITRFR
jgi:hypothetical protein